MCAVADVLFSLLLKHTATPALHRLDFAGHTSRTLYFPSFTEADEHPFLMNDPHRPVNYQQFKARYIRDLRRFPKPEILTVMFSFTDRELMREKIDAARRGGAVYLVLDEEQQAMSDNSVLKMLEAAKKEHPNIELHWVLAKGLSGGSMHIKSTLVSDIHSGETIVHEGSSNLSYGGQFKNVELATRLVMGKHISPESVQYLRRKFFQLYERHRVPGKFRFILDPQSVRNPYLRNSRIVSINYSTADRATVSTANLLQLALETVDDGSFFFLRRLADQHPEFELEIDRAGFFETELAELHDPALKNCVVDILNKVDDKVFIQPSPVENPVDEDTICGHSLHRRRRFLWAKLLCDYCSLDRTQTELLLAHALIGRLDKNKSLAALTSDQSALLRLAEHISSGKVIYTHVTLRDKDFPLPQLKTLPLRWINSSSPDVERHALDVLATAPAELLDALLQLIGLTSWEACSPEQLQVLTFADLLTRLYRTKTSTKGSPVFSEEDACLIMAAALLRQYLLTLDSPDRAHKLTDWKASLESKPQAQALIQLVEESFGKATEKSLLTSKKGLQYLITHLASQWPQLEERLGHRMVLPQQFETLLRDHVGVAPTWNVVPLPQGLAGIRSVDTLVLHKLLTRNQKVRGETIYQTWLRGEAQRLLQFLSDGSAAEGEKISDLHYLVLAEVLGHLSFEALQTQLKTLEAPTRAALKKLLLDANLGEREPAENKIREFCEKHGLPAAPKNQPVAEARMLLELLRIHGTLNETNLQEIGIVTLQSAQEQLATLSAAWASQPAIAAVKRMVAAAKEDHSVITLEINASLESVIAGVMAWRWIEGQGVDVNFELAPKVPANAIHMTITPASPKSAALDIQSQAVDFESLPRLLWHLPDGQEFLGKSGLALFALAAAAHEEMKARDTFLFYLWGIRQLETVGNIPGLDYVDVLRNFDHHDELRAYHSLTHFLERAIRQNRTEDVLMMLKSSNKLNALISFYNIAQRDIDVEHLSSEIARGIQQWASHPDQMPKFQLMYQFDTQHSNLSTRRFAGNWPTETLEAVAQKAAILLGQTVTVVSSSALESPISAHPLAASERPFDYYLELDAGAVTPTLAMLVQLCGPWLLRSKTAPHQSPQFMSRGFAIENYRIVGHGQHVLLKLAHPQHPDHCYQAIIYNGNRPDMRRVIHAARKSGQAADILFSVQRLSAASSDASDACQHSFNIGLIVKDIRPAQTDALSDPETKSK